MSALFESYGDRYFRGLDLSVLEIDQAYLITENIANREAYLYGAYQECVKCPLVDQYGILLGNATRIISTAREKVYKVLSSYVDTFNPETGDKSRVLCDVDTNFGEFGVYRLRIEDTFCSIHTLKDPVNIYLPIVTVLCIYFLFFGAIALCTFLVKTYMMKHRDRRRDEEEKTVKKKRVQSLDTFRGITIALMIFVNYGGGEYTFIEHAVWNGLHIADLVFPWFLWIMGVCIPISVRSTIKRGDSTKKALLNIARRSIVLFAIGLFLGGGSNLNRIRIFGVLQRFGICYFVVASIFYILTKMHENSDTTTLTKYEKMFLDITDIRNSWIIMIPVLLIYILILFLIPYKDCPRGYLGPGGRHEYGKYENCTGGITGYIDQVILGNHMYQGAAIRSIYRAQAFDPEGILGCLPSIFQVFIGVQAGVTLLTFKKHKSRLVRWFIWALILGVLGGALCGFSRDDGVIPINKHLWSVSFVLVTSSLAFLLLCICYILVDVQGLWSGKPFLYAGMNAIIIYIGHSMVYNNFPFRWYVETNSTHFIKFFENIWATSMWLLVAFVLYRKKYFLSI